MDDTQVTQSLAITKSGLAVEIGAFCILVFYTPCIFANLDTPPGPTNESVIITSVTAIIVAVISAVATIVAAVIATAAKRSAENAPQIAIEKLRALLMLSDPGSISMFEGCLSHIMILDPKASTRILRLLLLALHDQPEMLEKFRQEICPKQTE